MLASLPALIETCKEVDAAFSVRYCACVSLHFYCVQTECSVRSSGSGFVTVRWWRRTKNLVIVMILQMAETPTGTLRADV